MSIFLSDRSIIPRVVYTRRGYGRNGLQLVVAKELDDFAVQPFNKRDSDTHYVIALDIDILGFHNCCRAHSKGALIDSVRVIDAHGVVYDSALWHISGISSFKYLDVISVSDTQHRRATARVAPTVVAFVAERFFIKCYGLVEVESPNRDVVKSWSTFGIAHGGSLAVLQPRRYLIYL